MSYAIAAVMKSRLQWVTLQRVQLIGCTYELNDLRILPFTASQLTVLHPTIHRNGGAGCNVPLLKI